MCREKKAIFHDSNPVHLLINVNHTQAFTINMVQHMLVTILSLFGTAEALANQVTDEHYAKGMIYPPFSNIRKISANIAATVASKAYELGRCLQLSLQLHFIIGLDTLLV